MVNNLREFLVPLHIISLADGVLSGKTRLQKLIFLSQMEFNSGFDFNFDKAPLGPLSYKLLEIVDGLVKMNYIERKIEATTSGFKVFKYKLTDEGKNILEFGKKSDMISKQSLEANENVMKQYGKEGHVDLLDYVHNEYPDYREQ